MASFKEIQAQIEQLQQQAAAQRENELTGAIQRIRDLMQEYGITTEPADLIVFVVIFDANDFC